MEMILYWVIFAVMNLWVIRKMDFSDIPETEYCWHPECRVYISYYDLEECREILNRKNSKF